MKKSLIAYFSASGTTKKIANKLATVVKGDVFEIVPVEPYTKADLNWMNKKSRSSVEMGDRTCRPPIAATTTLAPYDVIFIGFPIWWYREPSVIDTFVESCDFSGKVIVPFCTSGTSGPGESSQNIATLAPHAIVKEARRFSSLVSLEKIEEWGKSFLD